MLLLLLLHLLLHPDLSRADLADDVHIHVYLSDQVSKTDVKVEKAHEQGNSKIPPELDQDYRTEELE